MNVALGQVTICLFGLLLHRQRIRLIVFDLALPAKMSMEPYRKGSGHVLTFISGAQSVALELWVGENTISLD